MSRKSILPRFCLAAGLALAGSCNGAYADETPGQTLRIGDDTIAMPKPMSPLLQQAVYAYVYGYAPVYFDVSMKTYTNVETPSVDPNKLWAPVNQFFHGRRQQTRDNTMGVAPNSDTLYSLAYLDLSKEPIVWHLPAWAGHYYVCPLHNQWADNISVGNRANPNPVAVDYVVTAPNWHGKLPDGVRRIQHDGDHAMILCRIGQDFDKASLDSAHRFQDGMTLTPLSAWHKGGHYAPPKGVVDPAVTPNMSVTVPKQIASWDAATFFSRLAAVLPLNPPTPEDTEAVAILKSFGVEQGRPFDFAALPADKQQALTEAQSLILPLLHRALGNLGPNVNGWPYAIFVGRYQKHYLMRGAAAAFGFSGNMKEDNMQSVNYRDAAGQQLNGDQAYTIHFAPGMTPPVDGFWSYTIYDTATFDIFAPQGRNPIGSHDNTNPLTFNADGSLDIYVQSHSTGDTAKDHNWLATPAGKDFLIYFRAYGPRPEMYIFNSATGLPGYVVPALVRSGQ